MKYPKCFRFQRTISVDLEYERLIMTGGGVLLSTEAESWSLERLIDRYKFECR